MKKFRMLMLTAAVCLSAAPFFNSCSSDDNSIPTDGSGVAGTFKMTGFNIPMSVDYNGDGTASSNLLSESDCFTANIIKLNSDHTYMRVDNFIDLASGLPACSEYSETGIWKREGDVITTTSSDTNGYTPYDTQFTYSGSNTLTASYTATSYPGADVDGNPTTLEGDFNYVFTRQAE